MNNEEFHKKIKKSEEKMVEAVVGDHKKMNIFLLCFHVLPA